MPDELHSRLTNEAVRNGRSLDEQVIAILDRALNSVHPVELPSPIVPLRSITSEELAAAIREGRE